MKLAKVNLEPGVWENPAPMKISALLIPIFFLETQVKWKAATLNLNAAFGKAQGQWKIQYSELPIFFRRPK